MDRLEKLSKQVLAGFTEEAHVRRSLEGRRYVTPYLLEQLILHAGQENVCCSVEELEKHSADHSHHLPSRPEVVVYARSTEMISRVMKLCYQYRLPVTPCGARTGLEGGAIPLGGVALDLSRMDQLLAVHQEELQAHVQAGLRKEALNEALAPLGLAFQVDPASNPTLGGMAATGASGTLCCGYGTMKENVVALTVVMADGRVVRTRRRTRKNSTGYELTQLCMGQEGTLCIVAELVVRLTALARAESSLQVAFERLEDCARAVRALRRCGVAMARCELLNRQSVESLNAVYGTTLPALPTLFLQVQGTSEGAVTETLGLAEDVVLKCGAGQLRRAHGTEDQHKMWDLRRNAYYACRANKSHLKTAQDVRMLSTDVCVPLSNFSLLIEQTEKDYEGTAAEGIPLKCNIFGHAADGNFHCVVLYDHGNPRDLAAIESLERRMWARCLALGGSVSGEHGCGMGKVRALREEWGEEAIELMWRLKKCLDDHEILNPGKLLPGRG